MNVNSITSLNIKEIFNSKNFEKNIKECKESALSRTEEIFDIDGEYIWEIGKKYKDNKTNFFKDISYFDQMVNAVLFIESICKIDNFCISDLKIKTINRSIHDYYLKHIAERYLRKRYDIKQDRKMKLKFQGKNVDIYPSGYISKDAITAIFHYYDFNIKETKSLTRFFNLSKKILKIDKL